MRRSRLIIILAIIVLLGVLALWLVMRTFGWPGGGGAEPGAGQQAIPLGQVVIAAQDIPRGALITEESVVTAAFPADLIVPTMMTDKALVVGRHARMEISRGVPITMNMLTELPGQLAAGGSSAAFAIPPGYTAIAIPMSRLSGVAYAVQDGDQVDVIISLLMVDLDPEFQTSLANLIGGLFAAGGSAEAPAAALTVQPMTGGMPRGRVETDATLGQPIYVIPSEAQRPRLVSQRLVRGATVLHVGTFALEGAEAQAAAEAAQTEGGTTETAQAATPVYQGPDIVTLIVTPQEALALNWAIKSGADLVLTLRSPNDTSADQTTSVTLQYLLDTYSITVPAKLSIGLEPRLSEPIQPVLPNDQ